MSTICAATSSLIEDLGLEPHPEGGYYTLTNVQGEKTLSPFAGDEQRQMSTSIYYLLSYDRPIGMFHMNKSITYHVLHQGRAEYTLITPGNPPQIEKKVIGTNVAAGETRMLLVGTGVWKRSSLLDEDMKNAATSKEKDTTNCLITEVVVPGFDWKDHQYMDLQALEQLFDGVEGGEQRVQEFMPFVSQESKEARE